MTTVYRVITETGYEEFSTLELAEAAYPTSNVEEITITISQEDLDAINTASILAQIAAIEDTITQRRLREAILGTDGGWLAAQEDEIIALRTQL